MSHIPVLLQEVIRTLDPKPGEFIIDGTLGAGGHAFSLIQRLSPNGIFLGVDRDARAIAHFNETIIQKNAKLVRLMAVQANYAQLPQLLVKYRLPAADGLLLDLGFSSDQVDSAEPIGRGFSFQRDEPLLMTYDQGGAPVKDLLWKLSEEKLGEILEQYGEERYARDIAHAIMKRQKQKPIETTKELTEVILSAVPQPYGRRIPGKVNLHPATKTFMALRIYANSELEHLEKILTALPELVRPGGRIAIISFHSLEDRIVKQFFKQHSYRASKRFSTHGSGEESKRVLGAPKVAAREGTGHIFQLHLLTKKPIIASGEELTKNPRSRSAKLRGAYVV